MRFIFGVLVGIGLTLGAAVLHDNNIPSVPQRIADQAIVNWEVFNAVVSDDIAYARNWWDGLMGRSEPPPQP